MTVFAAAGDPERSLELLWGQETEPAVTPGPKPGLSLDAIVAAAVAVADGGTMAGLSLRAVADRLGCSSMALYTYVPGKAELVDLMYDRVHAELAAEVDIEVGWRAAATAWAERLWSFYLRHPWVLQISFARPVFGPHEQAVLETLVGVLRETGLPADTVSAAVAGVFALVRGTAQTVADAHAATTATGLSEREWWATRTAALHRVAPDFAQRFPHSTWLGQAGSQHQQRPRSVSPQEWQARQRFGAALTLVLDGLGSAQDSRS